MPIPCKRVSIRFDVMKELTYTQKNRHTKPDGHNQTDRQTNTHIQTDPLTHGNTHPAIERNTTETHSHKHTEKETHTQKKKDSATHSHSETQPGQRRRHYHRLTSSDNNLAIYTYKT